MVNIHSAAYSQACQRALTVGMLSSSTTTTLARITRISTRSKLRSSGASWWKIRRNQRERRPSVDAGRYSRSNRLPSPRARPSGSAGAGIADVPERFARRFEGRVDHRLVVRAGDEARLVGARRQEHAAPEHGVEEAVERGGVAGRGLGVGLHLPAGEEQ